MCVYIYIYIYACLSLSLWRCRQDVLKVSKVKAKQRAASQLSVSDVRDGMPYLVSNIDTLAQAPLPRSAKETFPWSCTLQAQECGQHEKHRLDYSPTQSLAPGDDDFMGHATLLFSNFRFLQSRAPSATLGMGTAIEYTRVH